MRASVIVPLFMAAACSSGGDQPKSDEEASASMKAGQWQVSSEVTAFRSTDTATPALKAAVGDKTTTAACIEEKDSAKPKPELFAGEGYECDYKDSYIRNGRINATMSCKRDPLKGEIFMNVSGSYTATGFEAEISSLSYLPGDGDFAMNSKITGRRTADACAPAGDGDAKAGGNKAG